MKRSEMLEIIDQVVSNSKLSAYVDLPFDRVRELEAELSDSILDEVEKNMYPPEYHHIESDGLFTTDYGTIRDWEPENE